MPALVLTITDAGRAALVNANNDGTRAVRIATIGVSPTSIVPGPATTALPDERKRIATLSGTAVAADTLHVTVRDESSDQFTVRTIGLYLDNGTLFAAYSQPDALVEKSAQAIMLLAIDVRFADIDATQLTFGDTNFLNPPATSVTAGVVKLATQALVAAGIDDQTAITPRTLALAFASLLGQVWRASNDGAGSGLDADLLDGLDSSYFTNIPARLGFTPVRQGGGIGQLGNSVSIGWSNGGRLKASVDATDLGNFVFDSNITDAWRASNDGAGSGLDADLLDGRDSSAYALLSGATTFTGPVKVAYPNNLLLKADAANNNPTAIHRVDGTNYYILFSNPSIAPNEAFNGLRPLLINMSTGLLISQNGQVFSGGTSISGTMTINAATAWHAGNDGAGSGLDADLLDGFDSSYFTNITARLGYTPVNRAGDAMLGSLNFSGGGGINGISGGNGDGASYSTYNLALNIWYGLALRSYDGSVNGFYDARAGRWDTKAGYRVNGVDVWHGGNDGSGSGLDADLLDGYQASAFARLGQSATFGDLFAQRSDGTGVIFLGTSGGRYLYWNGSSYELPGAPLYISGGLAWHAGNDGAGSGLDADLLDGHDSGEFQRVVSSNYSPFGGHEILASGLRRCWGYLTIGADSGATFVYPISFTQWVRPVFAFQVQNNNTSQNQNIGLVGEPGLGSLSVYNAENTSLKMWIQLEGV